MIIYYLRKSDESFTLDESAFCLGDLVVISLPKKHYRLMVFGAAGATTIDSVDFVGFCPAITGDTILLRFDPVNGRNGNVRLLKWLSSVFQRPEVKAFFNEAVRISTFKESRWDAKVLADLYSLSPIQQEPHQTSRQIMAPAKAFIDYFGDTIKDEYYELIATGLKQSEAFKRLKSSHPRDFTKAFKLFKKENPEKTIYD